MKSSPILIIGATGLLGPYLMHALAPKGDVLGAARKNAEVEMDVRNEHKVSEVISRLCPCIVVHAVGFTDVDGCEREPTEAYALNRDSVQNVACALGDDSRLVYISSDQVYPDTSGPHMEDKAKPVNVYGASKFSGEHAALTHPNSLVLRTNIFGTSLTPNRRSLSDFVVESLRRRESITLFEDIYFSPLHMDTMAEYVVHCLDAGLTGVYNLGSRQGMSKKDFALGVARHMGLQTETAHTGSGATSPGRARRPKDMRMNPERLESAIGKDMPTLDEEISKL